MATATHHDSASPPPSSAENNWPNWQQEIKNRTNNEARAKKRYPWNLFLFLFLVCLVWQYTSLHLHHVLNKPFLFGTPLAILAAVKFLQSWIPEGPLSEDKKSLARFVLARPFATQWLVSLNVITGFMLFGTSSFHLENSDPTKAGVVDIAFHPGESTCATSPILPNLRATENESIAEFFQICRLDRLVFQPKVKLVVESPFDYQILDGKDRLTLFPWTTLHLRFPDDFVPKQFVVIRLIPGRNVPTGQFGAATNLTWHVLSSDGTELAQMTYDYSCKYFGPEERAVKKLWDTEGPERRTTRIYRELGQAQVDTSAMADWIRNLASFCSLGSELDLQTGDQIDVQLRNAEGKTIAEAKFAVPADTNSIQDITVNAKGEP